MDTSTSLRTPRKGSEEIDEIITLLSSEYGLPLSVRGHGWSPSKSRGRSEERCYEHIKFLYWRKPATLYELLEEFKEQAAAKTPEQRFLDLSRELHDAKWFVQQSPGTKAKHSFMQELNSTSVESAQCPDDATTVSQGSSSASVSPDSLSRAQRRKLVALQEELKESDDSLWNFGNFPFRKKARCKETHSSIVLLEAKETINNAIVPPNQAGQDASDPVRIRNQALLVSNELVGQGSAGLLDAAASFRSGSSSAETSIDISSSRDGSSTAATSFASNHTEGTVADNDCFRECHSFVTHELLDPVNTVDCKDTLDLARSPEIGDSTPTSNESIDSPIELMGANEMAGQNPADLYRHTTTHTHPPWLDEQTEMSDLSAQQLHVEMQEAQRKAVHEDDLQTRPDRPFKQSYGERWEYFRVRDLPQQTLAGNWCGSTRYSHHSNLVPRNSKLPTVRKPSFSSEVGVHTCCACNKPSG